MYYLKLKKLFFFTFLCTLSLLIFVYAKYNIKIDFLSNEVLLLQNYLKNDLLFIIMIFFIFTFLQIIFFPGSLLTVLISLIVGNINTFIIMFVSGLIASFFHYRFVSEVLSKPSNKLENKIIEVLKKIKNRSLLYLIVFRLLPGIPFSLFNLCCGLLKIKVSYFVISYCLGIGPKIFLYSNIYKIFHLFNIY